MSRHGEGRPKYEPTPSDRNTVRIMASVGVPQRTIARCVGIAGVDEKTLRKHFAREIETAAHMANAAVAQSLFEMATGANKTDRNTRAAEVWLKCRAGWKETTIVKQSGAINVTEGTALQRLESRMAGIAARIRPQEDPEGADGS